MQRFKNALRGRHGNEIIISAPIILFVCLLVIMLGLKVFPVFTAKQQLDSFADKLCRTAEVAGGVGDETDIMARKLTEATGLSPSIHWAQTGNIQLGESIEVQLTITRDIGFFTFGSFPVTIEARANGQSEVFRK